MPFLPSDAPPPPPAMASAVSREGLPVKIPASLQNAMTSSEERPSARRREQQATALRIKGERRSNPSVSSSRFSVERVSFADFSYEYRLAPHHHPLLVRRWSIPLRRARATLPASRPSAYIGTQTVALPTERDHPHPPPHREKKEEKKMKRRYTL